MSGPTCERICVYCSSSDAVAAGYFAAARETGRLLGQRRGTLVYGGGNIGLMGALARAVHEHGGKVIGVIPEFMREKELAYHLADELVVTGDMRERKAVMESRAEAFVILPGGFGTLEEMFEILTLKQLHRHQKPLIFLNTARFFDPLLELFEHLYREQFAKEEARAYYQVAATPAEVFALLDNYAPPKPVSKWF